MNLISLIMKSKFEEINSMLDSIKGGQADSGLFSGSTDPQGTRLCSEKCTDDCKNGVGTSTGTTKGVVLPDPTLPGGPVTNL